MATEQSRMYDGISDRYRSCPPRQSTPRLASDTILLTWPAVSHSCSRTVRSSRYMALLRKSIPIVAWYVLSKVSYMNLRKPSQPIPRGWVPEAVQRRRAYLVIRLVLPTLWSPRRTILLRFSGGEEKSAVTGEVAIVCVVYLVRYASPAMICRRKDSRAQPGIARSL